MTQKTKIFIGLISIILICSFCFLFFILTYYRDPNTNNQSPVSSPSAPVSGPGNVITLEPSDIRTYRFSMINKNDTVELRNDANKKFVINLDHKNWKNISWAPDRNKVSVLGESEPGKYDLFIYDFDTKSWLQATNYASSPIGITSYFWQDRDTVYFTQGESPDAWVHRYKYSSNEIVKLQRYNGQIQELSSDSKKIVGYENLENLRLYTLLDNEGVLIYKLDRVESSDSSILSLVKILFTTDSEKLVLFGDDGKFYKNGFGSLQAIEVTKGLNVYPVCRVNENVVLGYSQTSDNLAINTVNVQDDVKNVIAEGVVDDIASIDNAKTFCYDENSLMIAVVIDDTQKWYTNINGELEEQFVLKDAKEADIY